MDQLYFQLISYLAFLLYFHQKLFLINMCNINYNCCSADNIMMIARHLSMITSKLDVLESSPVSADGIRENISANLHLGKIN